MPIHLEACLAGYLAKLYWQKLKVKFIIWIISENVWNRQNSLSVTTIS